MEEAGFLDGKCFGLGARYQGGQEATMQIEEQARWKVPPKLSTNPKNTKTNSKGLAVAAGDSLITEQFRSGGERGEEGRGERGEVGGEKKKAKQK